MIMRWLITQLKRIFGIGSTHNKKLKDEDFLKLNIEPSPADSGAQSSVSFIDDVQLESAEINIGLDFGTSYTKGCWYLLDKEKREIVRWNSSWESDRGIFLRSCLWLNEDDVLTMYPSNNEKERQILHFKMAIAGQLIDGKVLPRNVSLVTDPYKLYASFFIAQCLKWVEQCAAESEEKFLKNKKVIWSGAIGIPIAYYGSKESDRFKEILNAALFMKEKIHDSEMMVDLDKLYQNSLMDKQSQTFDIVPELYAEASGLFSDFHTADGYYTFFDIGGGTVDSATTYFTRKEGKTRVNFLSAYVEPLGMDILNKASNDSSRLEELRRQIMYQTAKTVIEAKEKTESNWMEMDSLPIHMCGGGHLSDFHIKAIKSTYYHNQHWKLHIPQYDIRDLDCAFGNVKWMPENDKHRLLIAVGLSIPAGYGPMIQGFPNQNPKLDKMQETYFVDLDDRQRDLYGD